MPALPEWSIGDAEDEEAEADMVEVTPKPVTGTDAQPEGGRVVLSARAFTSLCQIVSNPKPPTDAAREAFARYRRMREETTAE